MAKAIQGEAQAGHADESALEFSLYERWKKIQPLWTDGRFQTLRRVALAVLLLVFYLGPWLRWDGRPAIWFDLPARQFTVFAVTFWPQDFVLLSWLLIIAAFSLFFFTVLAGRLFCGYACPQTVWTSAYFYIERWIEGDRTERMRRDGRPWTAKKLRVKFTKWALWTLLAASIGITFVGYFTPIRELLPKLVAFELGGWEAWWIAFPSAGSFLLSGVLREQVCLHMCPYARFQSVMFDRDTMIISYDRERGDPRGSRRRDADPAALGKGSCIDCGLCVKVCPTGIDIREGLQYQCIGCAACVDVCDSVMDRMGYDRGLVKYSSEHRDEHAAHSKVRPRLLGYGGVLAAMLTVFVWFAAHRMPLELDVIRDRNRLYREFWDGSVENVYTLRILNMEQADRTYRIRADGDVPFEYEGKETVTVASGQQASLPIRLRMSPESVTGAPNSPITFTVEADGEPLRRVSEMSRFLRPETAGG